MKHLLAVIGFLATASSGCTVAGAISGGAAASHYHETDEDMTAGEGAVLGAVAGLIVDAIIRHTVPDCLPPCDQHSGGALY